MSDDSPNPATPPAWRDWLAIYADAFGIIGGLVLIAGLVSIFAGWLPWPWPLIPLSIGSTLVSVFIMGHVFVSNNYPLTQIGRLWENEKAIQSPALLLPAERDIPVGAEPKQLRGSEKPEPAPKDETTEVEPFKGYLGYYSLFDLPPKRFPFYPPGYMLPVEIECYLSAYQGYPDTTLVVQISGSMTYQTTVACCLYVIEQFAEIVAEILAEIKADKGRAMTLRAHIIDPKRITLFHGPALTYKGHGDVMDAARQKGLAIWERHGPLLPLTNE